MRLTQEQCIESVKACLYKELEVGDIIKICKLHTINWGWQLWKDSGGNLFEIKNKRRIKIKYKTLIHSDLYLKTKPSDLINKAINITYGSDGKYNIWWLWLPDGIRYCVFNGETWLGNYPPILTGISALKKIIQNKDLHPKEKISLGKVLLHYPKIEVELWKEPDPT